MFQIGRMRKIPVKKDGKPVIINGEPEVKIIGEVLRRVTRAEYGHNSSHSRRLVVSLHGDDTITIKPYLGRDAKMAVTFNVGLVYKDMLRRKLMGEALEIARKKKDANKEVRARKARYAKSAASATS
jgi:hypothetical protein